MRKLIVGLCASVALTGVLWPVDARAQIQQEVTVTAHASQTRAPSEVVVTFSTPVALPGLSLGAGSYVFRVVDVIGKPIQVLSVDYSMVYGLVLPAAVHRTRTASAEMWIGEPLADEAPTTIQAWFPHGESIGYGFIHRGRQPSERLAQVLLFPSATN